MNVSRIVLRGFMAHANTVLSVPATGVVLVTGANGAGKSSVAECIATAVWGRTLRDFDPWPAAAGEAEVEFSSLGGVYVARRSLVKGKARLDWCDRSQPVMPSYDTVSKAQAALDAVVPAFDVWRRTAVLSSADAAHFTGASDAERKRMLEALLGLERFDAAREYNRSALRAAEGVLVLAERAAAAASAALASAEHAEAAVTAEAQDVALVTAESVAALEVALRDAAVAVTWLEEERTDAVATAEATATEAARAATAVSELAALEHELSRNACRSCGAPLASDKLAALTKLRAGVAPLAAQAPQLRALAAGARGSASEAAVMHNDAVQRRNQAEVALAAARAELRAAETVRDRLFDAQTSKAAAAAKVTETQAAVDAASLNVEELRAADNVLGLTGVRARLLAGVLSGIEAITETWLRRLSTGAPLKVRLRSHTTLASGAAKDAISIVVEGVGGRKPATYASCSQGERRRIDVALLFALAEVGAAASGFAPGTLVLDEVFDGLDTTGVDAVFDVLVDLAATRAVLVITHNEDIIRRMPQPLVAARWHVTAGQVTVS